ncbi:hypothetical protein VTK73DRAFT_5694 [Phialemonium thermophilum]|uniref:Uncharacterized protein n=1 Tax=Phialemonium thermophilum TaxID=223376 RepID=A0ABR3V0T4_9PEZI
MSPVKRHRGPDEGEDERGEGGKGKGKVKREEADEEEQSDEDMDARKEDELQYGSGPLSLEELDEKAAARDSDGGV